MRFVLALGLMVCLSVPAAASCSAAAACRPLLRPVRAIVAFRGAAVDRRASRSQAWRAERARVQRARRAGCR